MVEALTADEIRRVVNEAVRDAVAQFARKLGGVIA